MKRQSTKQEKIFANHVFDKSLISLIYKKFLQLKSKRKIVFEYTFVQKQHTNVPKYMKMCSTSLLIREMQIKTTMRHQYTSILGGLIFSL